MELRRLVEKLVAAHFQAGDFLEEPVEALNAAYDADHALERFGRRLVEEAMSGSQRRTASFLQLSPEERYTRFVATRPEIFRRVPQFLTASYLGITPEALSRIRGRRRKPGDEPL